MTEFAERILTLADRLAQFLRLGRKLAEAGDENIREWIVGYRLIYRIAGERVEILAIARGSRDLQAVAGKPRGD